MIDSLKRSQVDASIALLYFGLYLVYLFFWPESEFLHWISMVCLPLGLVVLLNRPLQNEFKESLASFGLRSGKLTKGIGWAFLLGFGLSVLQLFISNRQTEILDVIRSGNAIYLLPISFAFLLFTAGFTEEFMFRGFIQTRLAKVVKYRWTAILITAFLFGLYHIPYAYLNPNWPSYGDLPAAISAAMGQGVAGGLVLGWLYEKYDHNLLAVVIVHASINTLPATTMIKFGGG